MIAHGPQHGHRCLCLNQPSASYRCHPLMDCQGGSLSYTDVWYLQRGAILQGKNGEMITSDVLNTSPAGIRCPRCGDDLSGYTTDDFVYLKDDSRPYCSGECAIHAHRTNLQQAVDNEIFAQARRMVSYLDDNNGTGDHETAIRLLKLSEEVGEVMQAYIGMTGQNPRKGVTHTPGDVAAELCDVVTTALVALHGFTPFPEDFMLEYIAVRKERLEKLREKE